jgi:hypothetical protein
MAFATTSGRCDAGGRDGGVVEPHDAAPTDAARDDAGGVHSCDEAWALLGPHPCLSSGLDCDAGFFCDGFTACVMCPYVVYCDEFRHQVSITEATFPCDAGTGP